MGKKDIIERLQDYAKDYTTTTYHDDLIQEEVTEIESLRQQLAIIVEQNNALASRVAELRQGRDQLHKRVTLYEQALLASWPKGAKGKVFNYWNEARK